MDHHSHSHSHSHGPPNYTFAFAFGIGLNLLYIGVEVSYGLAIDSLALLADAGHNVSDVLGLLLAWAGYRLSQIPPSTRQTYGWRSGSILAAFLNALLLLIAVGVISWEAIQRFSHPVQVAGNTIMAVAGVGVVINLLTALLFLRGRKNDINIQGAFLHMAADAGVSLGVVFAGLMTKLYPLNWIDPSVSLLVAAVILLSTWSLFRDSTTLLLHGVPPRIDPQKVRAALQTHKDVISIHDLHIWAMSTTETALTAHLVVRLGCEYNGVLETLREAMADQFDIEHVTLQLEAESDDDCPQQQEDAV
ncbi:MAG: cation transporter [Planctomycetaceae bacterium TMED10]|nr:MAG: cation transporter [Planctomycetaceae bacterium TMED10]